MPFTSANHNLKLSTLKFPPTPTELANLIRGFVDNDRRLTEQELTEYWAPSISDEDGGTVRRWYIEGAGWFVCRYDRWQLQRGDPVHGIVDAREAGKMQRIMRYSDPRRLVARNTWLSYQTSHELSQDLGALGHNRRGRAQDAQTYWNKRFIKLLCLTGRLGFVSTDAPALIHHGR